MKISLFLIVFIIGTYNLSAQNNNTHKTMKNNQSTLRLIYPQWQGGGTIADFVPELPAEDAYKGYYLGSQLLAFLAPQTTQKTVEIPVTLDIEDRELKNGIISYQAILRQTDTALEILRENNPDRIVTLGGECSVSVVPFTYLASKYPDDVAIVWIDAHPDINMPNEGHKGYHAMALAASMGKGDKNIMEKLPAKVDSSNVLIVGLRAWETEGGTKERQKEFGIKSFSPNEVSDNSNQVLDWLKSRGVSKVLVHFDLDVIDPNDMIAAVGVEPNGMKINEVVRVINDISNIYDIVGLTIAEPMPRTAIKIRNMLNSLPLLKD